jgi:hydrogenase-4 membrane subunit HyfE
MSLPLIACLIATVIPVFFGKLGSTPTWLGLQALALGWITLNKHPELDIHALAAGLEIFLLRGLLVPRLLRQTLHKTHAATLDVMPSNLFAWGAAMAVVILAFQFGDGARSDVRSMTLGVTASTVVLAFFVLATNQVRQAQLVAFLFMENALALFETLMPEPWPWLVHGAISTLYVGAVAVGVWLMRDQTDADVPVHRPIKEEI